MRGIYRIAFAIVALVMTGEAFASTAANHIIRNEVQVTYSDAGLQPVETVTGVFVDVTVNLVQAAPDTALNVTDSDDVSAVSTNDTVTLVFDVTSNANGPDDYALEAEAFSGGASGNGESAGTPSPDPLTLGGSTAASIVSTFVTTDEPDDSPTGTTAISVPADDDGSDNSVNGFVNGDLIVLNATGGTPGEIVCTVNDLDEPTAGNEPNATATIYVDECSVASGPALAVGDQLGERAQISIDITVGTIAGTLNFDAEINESGGSGNAITQVVITIVAPDLNVYKFVRNVDNANGDSCTGSPLLCLSFGGETYHASGVTADPGEELEYAILLLNAGATLVTEIQVTDEVATFTTFNTGSIDMVAQGTADDSGNCESGASGTCTITGSLVGPATDGTTDDFGALVGSTVTVSGGHDGTGSAITNETDGGQLAVGEVSVIFFSVDVNN